MRDDLQDLTKTQSPDRIRGAIDFAVDGDIRFLSHLEMVRVFARACSRARVAVKRTEGFNPRPRITLPLPRPVGIASEAEVVVIELTEPCTAESLIELLTPQMPKGIELRRARMLEPSDRCAPQLVGYSVTTAGHDPATLKSSAANLLNSQTIKYNRYVHKRQAHTTVDLRPFINSIEVNEDRVDFSIKVCDNGSAKPTEVCEIMGMGKQINHLIRRTDVAWKSDTRQDVG